MRREPPRKHPLIVVQNLFPMHRYCLYIVIKCIRVAVTVSWRASICESVLLQSVMPLPVELELGGHLPDFCIFTVMLGPPAVDSILTLVKERSIGDVLGQSVVVKMDANSDVLTVRFSACYQSVSFQLQYSVAPPYHPRECLLWLCVRRKWSAKRKRKWRNG